MESLTPAGIVFTVLIAFLFAMSLYFTLSYIKENDKRLIEQSKIAAVVSLFIAVLLCLFFLIS